MTAPTYMGNTFGPALSQAPCNACMAPTVVSGDCGCGSVSSAYPPSFHDPYSGIPHGENVISDVVIGGDSLGYSSNGVPVGSGYSGDNFQGRSATPLPGYMTDQFDSEGNRIMQRQNVN
ncbi:MAG: hypothetical protein AAF989_12090 [Planctomycetota bacterium]